MLVAAIEHKGFSFVQAMSPCPTFRPEQMNWKHQVKSFAEETTADTILAAQRIQADDGMSTGIIFKREYPVFQPGSGGGTHDVSLFESEFEI